MKKYFAVSVLAASILAVTGCQEEKAEAPAAAQVALENVDQQQAYAIGASVSRYIATTLEQQKELGLELDNALVSFKKIQNLVADNPSGLIQLGQLQADAQLYQQALANIAKSRELLNDDGELDMQARLLQADILFKNNQPKQSMALARSVILDAFARDERRTLKLQAMYLIGEIYRFQGNHTQAVKMFTELFTQGMPNQAGVYLYELAIQGNAPDNFTIVNQ